MWPFVFNFISKGLKRWVALPLFAVVAALVIPLSTVAKTYDADVVSKKHTTLFGESGYLNGIALDDLNLVYFARLNTVEGLYSFNSVNNKTVLLQAFQQIGTPGEDPWGGRYHAAKDGLALLSIRGKLYATDGTPSGTKLIRDFGSYSCCGSYPIIQSVIKSIQYIDSAFYITTNITDPFYPYSSKAELWRSDGTSLGTKKLGTTKFGSSQSRIRMVFSALINGKETILFIVGSPSSGVEMWKINEDDSTSLMHQFAPNVFFTSLGTTVRNSNGTFLCSSTLIEGRPPEQTNLWRISNNGTLTSIESGCFENTLALNEGRVFYLNQSGLQSTDGRDGNSKIELTFSMKRNVLSPSFCEVSGSLVYAIDAGRMLTVKNGEISTSKAPMATGIPRISICSNNMIIIEQDDDSSESYRYVIDTSTDGYDVLRHFFEVVPTLTLNDGDNSLGVLESNRNEVIFFGKLASDESALIKVSPTTVLAPQIMLLLEDNL